MITHKAVRTLTFLTIFCTLFAVFFNAMFQYLFNFIGFEPLFALSNLGLAKGYYFEFLTYPFLMSKGAEGLSIGFLINFFFASYAFFMVGKMVSSFTGEKKFVGLYFFSVLFTGVVVALLFSLTNTPFLLSGPFYVTMSIITVWGLISEYQKLFILVFPIETRFFAFGALALVFLNALSNVDFLALTGILSSVIAGYLFTTTVLQVQTPFEFLHPMDKFFNNLYKKKLKEQVVKGKVIDFETGEVWLSDEEFLSKILEKVAKTGENSLSRSEKRRLDELTLEKHKR